MSTPLDRDGHDAILPALVVIQLTDGQTPGTGRSAPYLGGSGSEARQSLRRQRASAIQDELRGMLQGVPSDY